ncbi:MAG: bifunctional nuclease family protein [Fimbriimonas sp.]
MAEEFEGAEDLDQPPAFFPYEGGAERRANLGELVEVRIDGVYEGERDGHISRFVMLTDGERRLPILIGAFEAHAIQAPMEGAQPERPMTHDLIRKVLDRLGCPVDRVVIDDLWNAVYYAKIYLRQDKGELEIDSRPSDAIAMAVRFNAPIFVADGILDQAFED